MGTQILRRIASGLLVLIVVSIAVFVLLHTGQDNAARAAAGGIEATKADIEAARVRLGLDRSLVVQYLSWASGALHGDFGNSYVNGLPVFPTIMRRFGLTLQLAVLSLLVGAIIAILVGTRAASRPRGILDKFLTAGSTLGVAIPEFAIALFLVTYMAVGRSWFPATGYVGFTESVGGWAWHLVLPVVTLSIPLIAELSRYVRAAVYDSLQTGYVDLLYLQGFRERTILTRYVLKASAVPFTTVIGLQFTHLLGGIVVVETIFDLPGIGSLAVNAVLNADLPTVAAIAILICALTLVVNFLVDIAHTLLDPRVVMR